MRLKERHNSATGPKWVDWFNNRRLLEPIGYTTPVKAEEAFYENMNAVDKVA